MIKKFFILFILVICSKNDVSAQIWGNSSEFGIMAGPIFFQSDYGQRFDTKTNFGNNGFGIGIFHVTNFSHNYDQGGPNPMTFFNDHFKLKTDVSFNKSEFRHYGKWVDAPTNNVVGQNQLRAMRGNTTLFTVGTQMEYYPWSIYNSDLAISRYNLAPYVSIGVQHNWYTTKSYSMLGNVDNPAVTPVKYLGASRSETNTVWSVSGSVGARYKIGDVSDIILDFKWQQFTNNWVDGLNPLDKLYPENRSNDWQFWITVGYVIHIE